MQAGFIVETTVPGKEHVPFSQGSHFFQNIVSFGIGCDATVDLSLQLAACSLL